MNRRVFLLVLFLNFILLARLSGTSPSDSESYKNPSVQQDTLPVNQILFNGRVWTNQYYMVEKDQFLFSKDFLPGTLTITGKTFTNVSIRYDLFKDELLTPFPPVGILQVNKEMVDSFSVLFQNKLYHFIRIPEDSLNVLSGYLNVLYKGKSALYVKYNKKIDRPTREGENDKFYQLSHIYFEKNNRHSLITSKRDLYRIFYREKVQIKAFIKKNKIRVSKNNPESFIPVIRYYDTISQ